MVKWKIHEHMIKDNELESMVTIVKADIENYKNKIKDAKDGSFLETMYGWVLSDQQELLLYLEVRLGLLKTED